MNQDNAFFKTNDNRLTRVAGYSLPDAWWSRSYEYAFAIQFAEPGQVVADMGSGCHYRPFKDALAEICGTVYAVDAQPLNFSDEKHYDNLKYIRADFTKPIDGIKEKSLDRIFCISVLEDLGEFVKPALKQFEGLLKPEGIIVLTMDSQYDDAKPLGQYPGVNMENFVSAVYEAGLAFRDVPDYDKKDAVYHSGFNLTPYHCILVKNEQNN